MKDSIVQKKTFSIPTDTLIANEERTNRIYLLSGVCQFQVFVKDVLLLKIMGEITKKGGRGVTGSFDINQLMLIIGLHEVKVWMCPVYGLNVFGG